MDSCLESNQNLLLGKCPAIGPQEFFHTEKLDLLGGCLALCTLRGARNNTEHAQGLKFGDLDITRR